MLKIHRISLPESANLAEVSELLASSAKQHVIGCNCWRDQFPYTPQVSFQTLHNNRELFIRFLVQEKYIMAQEKTDQGDIWRDSCVELFISFDDTGYYNFEFSCIGKLLLGFRKSRPEGVFPENGITHSVRRISSLGDRTFDERTGNFSWELVIAIPLKAFFKHQLTHLSGEKATANFYKCGSDLTEPHYLSWQPIENHKPDFHTPAFFGQVEFE